MPKTKEKLMIIDGNALIHRSYHALPPLKTKSGEVINAVYGFTSVLMKALREFKPKYVILTLDRKEKTFRHERFADYKGTRIKGPDDLYSQIPRVKEIAQAFNIPIFELAGFEADDLIGTLASKAKDTEKIIVTGDMDTMQLIDDNTKVYTLKHGLTDAMIYDAKAVKERYGLEPEQMIDFKALRGDPSDNIPGVRGIGEKTASELLKQFGTLEGIYKYIEEQKTIKQENKKTKLKIRERIADLLISHKKEAYLSKELATIKRDCDIELDLDKASFGSFDREKLISLFNELEFKSLLPRLQALMGEFKNKSGENGELEKADKFKRNLGMFKYELIDLSAEEGQAKFDKFLKKLKQQKEFAFDTETANFDPVSANILGISFSWKEGEAYYVNFQFSPPAGGFNFQLKNADLFNYNQKRRSDIAKNQWLEKLKPIFEDEKVKKYGHNVKYDIEVMASQRVKVKGIAADSMVASYLLNPGSRQHNLDAVTFKELNHEKISKDDLLGNGRKKTAFAEVALEKLYNYSCEDADFTNRLVKKLLPELKKQKLDKLFEEIEMPLVMVLSQMEINGVKIDEQFLGEMDNELDKKMRKLEKKIHDMAGSEFNINSTQQLREVLFEKLVIPTLGIAKGKTGFSTGADELAKLKGQHPIIDLIQEYRELTKLSTTYIKALPKLTNKETGRLHTSFNQAVTATGRLSSTEPNLQNIPIRTELGRRIRQAFIADQGYKLLSLDYSQIELRLAAHMARDKKMIKAFLDGVDIHSATAAEINRIKLEEVTPELRREAKTINFGVLYGQGPHGLSQTADIPYARAREFIAKYFESYGQIKKFLDQTISLARSKGYTETLFKRRRFMPDINSSVMQARKAAERMAINTPLQGTAADIIKIAMIKIELMLEEFNQKECGIGKSKTGKQCDPVRMILQVHDELVFEVREDLVLKITPKIKNIMESVIKLDVPIIAEAKQGKNWGNMEKVE